MYKSLRYIFWFISILFFIFLIYQLSKFNFNLICFFEQKYQYIAYVFGAIGGLFAIENFYRKEGLLILGDISTKYFFGKFEDNFDISFVDLILINRKDKPVIIFDIYIKIASNTHIHLKEVTKENPIIIKGYEYYHERFNEAYFYSSGINAYSLRLSESIKKHRVQLHTSEGIYTVKKLKSHNQFHQFYSRILKPARLESNKKTVPLDTAYIINFYDSKDILHTVYIKKTYTWFQIENYKFEWSVPLNNQTLEQKFNIGIQSGILQIKSFKIINFQEELKSMKKRFIQFDGGYNLLKIQSKIEKSDRKKMIYIYFKQKLKKIISNIKRSKM